MGLTIAAQAAWSALIMPASGCVEKCQSHSSLWQVFASVFVIKYLGIR